MSLFKEESLSKCGYGKNYYRAWWCKEVAQIKVHKAVRLAKAPWGRVLELRPQGWLAGSFLRARAEASSVPSL